MKNTAILTLQSKGQVMIPKEWRDEMGTPVYQAVKDGDTIILTAINVPSTKNVIKTATQIMKKNKALLASLAKK